MANVHYKSKLAEELSKIHDTANEFYPKSHEFLGIKYNSANNDGHRVRQNYRAQTEVGQRHADMIYQVNADPHDFGMRSSKELNKAMENFRNKQSRKEELKRQEQNQQMAKQGVRDWKNHKYTAKVVGKNGKVRYIYSNPNNGGRTTIEPAAQPKSGKMNLKQSNNSAKVQAPKKSGSNIISDGMKAVSGLLDSAKNLPIAKLFG